MRLLPCLRDFLYKGNFDKFSKFVKYKSSQATNRMRKTECTFNLELFNDWATLPIAVKKAMPDMIKEIGGSKNKNRKQAMLTASYQKYRMFSPLREIERHDGDIGNLIYATLRLKNKRAPSPKFITTRNDKRVHEERFKNDIETAPFHVASVFDDEDDALWAWQHM